MAANQPNKTLDVFVSAPAGLDLNVFSLWLKGCDVQTATRLRQDSEPEISREFEDFQVLLFSDTQDQYRLFNTLEPYLQLPSTLMTQQLIQLTTVTKYALVEQYYTFDEEVVREFLGKKLNSKNRKDLDDVYEKTKISLKSCKRQFDNIKQVLRVVDDYEGSLVENIKSQFCLSEDLARSYASVVFISNNRFETNKKKLAHLSFTDFTYCANLMIEHWTVGSEGSHAVDDDLELDRYFLQELHDLKLAMVDRVWIDRQQKLVVKDLRKKRAPNVLIKSVEHNFKAISKSLTLLGCSLIHSKDVKDYFIDLIEKIVEPCKQLNWEKADVELLLTSMAGTFAECEAAHSKQTGRPNSRDKPWRIVYLRYLDSVRNCILAVYH